MTWGWLIPGIRVDLSRCTLVDAANHLHSLPTHPPTPCCLLAEVTAKTSFFTRQCTLRVSIALVKAAAQGAPEEMLFLSLKTAEPQLCWTTPGC